MKTLTTSITINASAQKVWQVLMNHKDYPNWNPFIKQITGDPQEGASIQVTLQPENKKPMEFSPIVLNNEAEKEFRWLGHLFVKGLFDGEHFFKLEEIDANKTKVIHGENFTGIMASVLLSMIGESTQNGFVAMNNSLKNKVESLNNIS